MIRHMSYVACDLCEGWPCQLADEYTEARENARGEGFVRRRVDGRLVDICPGCNAEVGSA